MNTVKLYHYPLQFFSKVMVVLNISFVIAAILRQVENAHKKAGAFDGALKLQPLESTLVIMGYGAIFVNVVFNLLLLILILAKVNHHIARWICWFNFMFLIIQIYYFFFTS